jgi:hypothetical protein
MTDVIFANKGVVWLLIATVAGVPPAVRSAFPLAPLILPHRHIVLQVLVLLNLNGIF